MNFVVVARDFLRNIARFVRKAYDGLKRRCQPLMEDKETLKQYYFESATHYYALARYAVFARAVPVSSPVNETVSKENFRR